MIKLLQTAVAGLFLVSLGGVVFYSAPPFGTIWRSIILVCAVLGSVIAIVGYFRGKDAAVGGPKH